MKKISVTIVSDELPKGCGLATYHDNLIYCLKKNGVDVKSVRTIKLFGNYPVRVSSKLKTEIVHFTDQKSASVLFFSLFRRYKTVITTHDITEIINFNNVCRIDSLRKRIVRGIWSRIMKSSLKRAEIIIADSEHTKKEIIRIMGSGSDIKNRIKVIYIAADDNFKPCNIKKDPYSILYAGSNLAHKNLKTLLRAFSLLKKRIPESRLILIGKSLVGDKDLQTLVKSMGLNKDVIFKGYAENMPKEYSKASLTVVPSLYEGFGLPVLEAMSCGCPVICSDKTSLPEVGGDAATYFDGHDVKDLANKIYEVLTNNKLKNDLIKGGLVRAKLFSWERTTKEILKVYQRVLKDC